MSEAFERPDTPALLSSVLAVFLSIVVWSVPAGAQTILNVERLQPGDVKRWYWGVEGALSVSRGNADYVDALAGVVAGYRWSRDWLRVFAGAGYLWE